MCGGVANIGSKIAAGIFNQGIQEQRDLVCVSTSAKSICSTLELCKPSLTHLFGGDESRIRCGELAHAALGKDSPLIQRMKDVCAGESPT
jgi:hypothetical protein